MRTCGAEKLPWLVVEVEVDAERAGCFAERQVRLGLGVDEAIPETRDRLGSPARGTQEAEFYEIDFPLTNPETHNIGTKSQQRAHGTEVQNERSVERDFLFVFTATNKKIDLEMKIFPRLRSACGPDVRAGVRPRRLWLSLSGASWIGN